MEELRKLVKELEQLTDKKEIVAKLQEIGAGLINKYEIKVGNVTIEPLLVEAYYYDKDKFFNRNLLINKIPIHEISNYQET